MALGKKPTHCVGNGSGEEEKKNSPIVMDISAPGSKVNVQLVIGGQNIRPKQSGQVEKSVALMGKDEGGLGLGSGVRAISYNPSTEPHMPARAPASSTPATVSRGRGTPAGRARGTGTGTGTGRGRGKGSSTGTVPKRGRGFGKGS